MLIESLLLILLTPGPFFGPPTHPVLAFAKHFFVPGLDRLLQGTGHIDLCSIVGVHRTGRVGLTRHQRVRGRGNALFQQAVQFGYLTLRDPHRVLHDSPMVLFASIAIAGRYCLCPLVPIIVLGSRSCDRCRRVSICKTCTCHSHTTDPSTLTQHGKIVEPWLDMVVVEELSSFSILLFHFIVCLVLLF